MLLRFVVLLLLSCNVAAQAATLQISPVMVQFASEQSASMIVLRNPDKTPIYGQVRVYAWDQRQGEDVLQPTDEIQASPPIIKLMPQSEQVVRVVRVSATPTAIEKSYRLLIDEIPDPAASSVSGVVMRLRYSVPVFAAGTTRHPQPELSWQVMSEGKEWLVHVRNTGTRAAQIASFQLLNAQGQPVASLPGLVGYVLAKNEYSWRMPAMLKNTGPVHIKTLINGGELTATPGNH